MKELKMYIDGRFIENQSDKWIDVLNPSTEEVISKMPDGTPEDARAAINAAVKAQLSWESLTSIERAGYLTRIAQGIRKREQELTDIIIREGGKTRGLANVEVLFTADYLDYMAGWARRYEGEIIPSGILWGFFSFFFFLEGFACLLACFVLVRLPSIQTGWNLITGYFHWLLLGESECNLTHRTHPSLQDYK